MRKLGKVCSLLAFLAICGFFAAGNLFTVILFGGIAALFAFAAHVLNKI